MTKRNDSKGPSVPAKRIADAVKARADGEGFLGMMTLVGQTGIKVQTEAGSFPLPDGDYVILLLKADLPGDPRVAWIRAEDEKLDTPTKGEPPDGEGGAT